MSAPDITCRPKASFIGLVTSRARAGLQCDQQALMLARFRDGDYGVITLDDIRQNEDALREGGLVWAVYPVDGQDWWVVGYGPAAEMWKPRTDKPMPTVMHPEEYQG